jgi:hypothetical protein
MLIKRIGGALVAVLTVMIAVCALLPAHAARAGILDSVTCTGTSDVTFTPGLTLTPQTVTVDGVDSAPSCVSSDPTITATIAHPFTYPVPNATCNDVMFTSRSQDISWNNGHDSFISTLTFELTSAGGITQETGTGTITSGEFTGDTAVLIWAYPLVDPLLCLAPGGLPGQDGTFVIEVTGL